MVLPDVGGFVPVYLPSRAKPLSLRGPAEPPSGLWPRLQKGLFGRPWHRRLLLPAAVAVAAGLLLLTPNWPGSSERNWVQAMAQAVMTLDSYHGVLEKQVVNADGEEWLVNRVEIWSEGPRYAVRDADGTLTVSDGERRWQVRPRDRVVAVLPVFPDPRCFDLKDEARSARQYPHEVIGHEIVAGRDAVLIQVAPPGGLPYHLWIDAETDMPLQLRTAMQNALQTTYTFTRFEVNAAIDPAGFDFEPPEGYRLIEEDPGQKVHTPVEAERVAGFAPPWPDDAPDRILAHKARIVLDYGDTFVVATRSGGPFEPSTQGALGRAGDGPLEILDNRLRWAQDGVEVRIEGPRRIELARQIVDDLWMPDSTEEMVSAAEVAVPVDINQVEADQQQVDAGHSPWRLDPVYVAVTFVNLRVTPGGIEGEPEIPFSEFTLLANTGREAIVEVAGGPVSRVYLMRLVRVDESGIWSVVGYDPRG